MNTHCQRKHRDAHDGSGRMIAKRFMPTGGGTTCLLGFTTQYDPTGNKLYERALHAESRSALYPDYDSIDRLLEYQRGTLTSGGASVATSITLPNTDTQRTYDLDHLGNWKNTAYTPVGGAATSELRRHNLVNQVTKVGSTAITYDHGNNASNPSPIVQQQGNGNITGDGTFTYTYDALNRLLTVFSSTHGAIASYTYDALGRRILKGVSNSTVADVTYRYLYDGQQIVEELLASGSGGTTLRQFIWGHYIDELVQLNVPTTTSSPPLTAGKYYPLQDLLYRTTATTNSSGDIIEAYDYDAYGNTLIFNAAGTGGNWWADDATTTAQAMCEFLFTGRQYDPESGNYWLRTRYYHMWLSRFLGRDSDLYRDGPNLYLYVRSSPQRLTDPIGLGAATQPAVGKTQGKTAVRIYCRPLDVAVLGSIGGRHCAVVASCDGATTLWEDRGPKAGVARPFQGGDPKNPFNDRKGQRGLADFSGLKVTSPDDLLIPVVSDGKAGSEEKCPCDIYK